MGITLVNTTGSGSVKNDAVSTYSYSEDVTSLEPSNLTGGTSQVVVSAIAVEGDVVGATHPSSNLLINNTMLLSDSEKGSVSFQVKKLNNSNGVVAITGDTIMARLNVTRTALPHGGTGYTILSAIEYYCALVGVTSYVDPTFAAELEEIEVNFIGWTGNVWEHLKMLCAGVSASLTDNVGIEMFADGDTLVFRKAKTATVDFGGNVSASSIDIESFEAAQTIEVYNYNTRYGINEVVKEQTRTSQLFAATQNVSITDSMQVESGQTLTKRFKINATLETVEQPQVVGAILPLPYSGATGQYVVVGNDDLPIDPDQWIGQGGSLTVTLTDVPDEIEISIVAPPAEFLLKADALNPEDVTYAPYKVGVETAGDVDYPALWIVGTGVFFEKTLKTFGTGASGDYTSKSSAQTVDNLFITNKFDQGVRGVAAAQAACGPKVVLSQSVVANDVFGSTPGKVQSVQGNKFRVGSISFGPGASSVQSAASTQFSDFDTLWAGKTFADFTAVAFDPIVNPLNALKFNEFTVIPLLEA